METVNDVMNASDPQLVASIGFREKRFQEHQLDVTSVQYSLNINHHFIIATQSPCAP